MKFRVSVVVGVVVLVATLALARPTFAASDPKAAALADKVLQSLGGADAWNNTHYLRFDFAVDKDGKTVVRRAHTWDKWTGQYRLDATSKDGEPVVVLMNVNTKEGSAFLKGKKLEGDEAKKSLDQAYGTWVNDTYWLLMPYKMKDPGVILALDGEDKQGAEAWDKVRLTFDNVGLTPKDKYWAYVNRKTGLVDRWDFVLKGEKKKALDIHLEELEGLRQDPARGRPAEPRRDADLFPGSGGPQVRARGGLHDTLTGSLG